MKVSKHAKELSKYLGWYVDTYGYRPMLKPKEIEVYCDTIQFYIERGGRVDSKPLTRVPAEMLLIVPQDKTKWVKATHRISLVLADSLAKDLENKNIEDYYIKKTGSRPQINHHILNMLEDRNVNIPWARLFPYKDIYELTQGISSLTGRGNREDTQGWTDKICASLCQISTPQELQKLYRDNRTAFLKYNSGPDIHGFDPYYLYLKTFQAIEEKVAKMTLVQSKVFKPIKI